MDTHTAADAAHWTEDDSVAFLEYGRYFIPQRELQLETISELIAPAMGRVVDLCCGEGGLSERILHNYAGSSVLALDGSDIMLERARRRLSRFGPRVRVESFDLADAAWRADVTDATAVVAMYGVHHLSPEAKRQLFRDLHSMLQPGGVVVIADVVKPAAERGMLYTSREYERDVRRRARDLDGDKAPSRILDTDGWNMFRYNDDPTDQPSPLCDQLRWLEEAGFSLVDVHWMHAGHAIYSGVRPGA